MASHKQDMDSKPPPFKKRRLTDSSNPVMATTTQETSKDFTDDDALAPRLISRGLSQAEREAQVGILHFVNASNPGFSAILKKRYTDFIVNEISVDGKVLHLTDDRVPRREAPKNKILINDSLSEDEGVKTPKPPKPPSKPVSSFPELFPGNLTLSLQSETPTTSSLQTHNTSILAASSNGASTPSPLSSTKNHKSAKMANSTATGTHPNPQAPTATTTMNPPQDVQTFTIVPDDIATLIAHFGQSITDQIIELHLNILSKPGAKPSTFGFVMTKPILEKSARGAIHSDVRRIFESRLETAFQPENQAIKITAVVSTRKPNGQGKSARQPRTPGNDLNGKVGWNHMGGEYLHCLLYKENKDTMEVVNLLARSIGCKPKDITTSGTKDRRAVTTQGISVFRQKPETLKRAAFNLYNVQVGNFIHKKLPLELGELGGNQFTITLRDVDLPGINLADKFERLAGANAIVSQAMQSLRESGFINYFGLQRFGSHAIGTEVIGKMILNGDFNGAIFAGILECENKDVARPAFYPNAVKADKSHPSVSEDDLKRYRAITIALTQKKYKEALQMMPKRFVAETAVLRHLMHDEKDALGALQAIPHGLQTMYVHAYQSLVFNHVASERYARYGTKVVEGDLVLINAKPRIPLTQQYDEVDENGEVIVRPAAHDASVTRDDIFDRARPITAEEVESGVYTIFDVVLPTPGYDIEYPQNDIGDFYKIFMASEQGGGLDPAKMRRAQKTFSLSGSYRHFMGRVGIDMSVDYHLYVDENDQFVETDFEKLVRMRSGQAVANKDAEAGTHKRTDSNGSSNKSFIPKTSPHLRWTPEKGLAEIPANEVIRRSSSTQTTMASQSTRVRRPANPIALGLWGQGAALVQADDQVKIAQAEIEKNEREAAMAAGVVFTPIQLEDTWIKTGGSENEGKRTGHKERNFYGGIEYEEVETTTSISEIETSTENHIVVETQDVIAAIEAEQLTKNKSEVGIEDSELTTIGEDDVPVKEMIAAVVKFSLPSSTYATMVLREASKGGVEPYQPTNA